MFLTDAQWELIEPCLRVGKQSRRGRPRQALRPIWEAILFVLHTGIQWRYLPRSFPPKSTVHDYLQEWSQRQAFRQLMAAMIRSLARTGRLELEQGFIDATFAPAKNGGEGVGLTRKGKGTKIQ
jgi:transposase